MNNGTHSISIDSSNNYRSIFDIFEDETAFNSLISINTIRYRHGQYTMSINLPFSVVEQEVDSNHTYQGTPICAYFGE